VRRIACIAVVAFGASACGEREPEAAPSSTPAVVVRRAEPGPQSAPPTLIAGTDVPDTAQNRRVIDFCERYRRAVEARDATTLLKLASPRYFEDAGTPAKDDDLSYAGLGEYLHGMFQETEQVQYQLHYRAIRSEPDSIVVEVRFSATYVIQGTPRRTTGDNVLVLERHQGSFRFLSGM
jgi:hypothetical protein